MILITGAGGKTGRALIKTLSPLEDICALVHRDEQVLALKTWGARRVLVGDVRDEAVVQRAVQGVRALYHICPNMSPDEMEIGALIIAKAKQAGVEHFMYHSVLHPQTEKMPHHWQKMRVEEMIFESGMQFTILQPAPYMQNLLANWKSILEDGVLKVPYSVDVRFSFVDLKDVAEAVKVVITQPGHRNAVYELAGTLPTSHAEVAQIFGQVLNRDVRVKREEIGDWKLRVTISEPASHPQSKRDDYMLETLIRMFEYYDQWGLVGNPNVLRWLLKREATSLASFVQRIWEEHNE